LEHQRGEQEHTKRPQEGADSLHRGSYHRPEQIRIASQSHHFASWSSHRRLGRDFKMGILPERVRLLFFYDATIANDDLTNCLRGGGGRHKESSGLQHRIGKGAEQFSARRACDRRRPPIRQNRVPRLPQREIPRQSLHNPRPHGGCRIRRPCRFLQPFYPGLTENIEQKTLN